MNRKLFTIVVSFIVITIVFLCVVVTFLQNRSQPYFANFDDAIEVETYVLSTVSLDGTSIVEVRDLVSSYTYGDVDCKMSTFTENDLVCTARSGRTWWYYTIIFYFSEDILTDVEVHETYRGL